MKTFLRFMVITTFAIVGFLTFSAFKPFSNTGDPLDDISYYGGAYSVLYSQEFEQPLEIAYTVNCEVPKLDRKGMDFKHTSEFTRNIKTSDNDDYKNNVWDKGHLAPAASFACNEAQFNQTFDWLNCALQHESLNRGPWKDIEAFERDLAKVYDTVHVTIRCDFNPPYDVLETGATIPNGFRRYIEFGDQEIWLYFPNDSTVKGRDWSEFKTKLRRFEPRISRLKRK